MERSHSETSSSNAGQENPLILWTQEVYYFIYKNLKLIPILSQIKLIHVILSYLLISVWLLFSYLHLVYRSASFPRVPRPVPSMNFSSAHCVHQAPPVSLSVILSPILFVYNSHVNISYYESSSIEYFVNSLTALQKMCEVLHSHRNVYGDYIYSDITPCRCEPWRWTQKSRPKRR